MASSSPPNGDTIEKAPKIDFNEPLKMTRTKTTPVEGSSASAAGQPAPINEKSVDQPAEADKGKKAAVKEKTLDIVSRHTGSFFFFFAINMRVYVHDDSISQYTLGTGRTSLYAYRSWRITNILLRFIILTQPHEYQQ